MKQTEYGNDECPVETRSIYVFFRCERLTPQREKLEQRKGTGEVTYVTEPVLARSAEQRYIKKNERKLKYDIEAVLLSDDDNWIGINQILSNRLVEFFFNEHELEEIVSDFDSVQREVNLGISKLDFKVGDTYLEVKTPLTTPSLSR